MRIFISTGEVSGDLQGAMLIKSLYQIAATTDIELEIAALGGERMKAAGANILADTAAIGSVGLLEALPFVIPTLKIQYQTQKYLRQYPPDVLVLIDYPAANLAIASYVKKHLPNIVIIYYIAPQDWAVPKLNNAPKITRVVDKLLAIFPAEAEYFQNHNIDVTWVGHPLLDRIENSPSRTSARSILELKPEQLIVTLLPASRRQELQYLLPVICQAAQKIQTQLPNIHFLIPVSLESYRVEITAAVAQYNLSATILNGKQTIEAIASADLAIAKSGTVNLEVALLNIPQIVVYRVHPFTAWVARKILGLDIPLMSPPNLIVKGEIVPEFKQEAVTVDNITNCALKLLQDENQRQQIVTDYQQMRSLLGTTGVCDRAAREIIKAGNSPLPLHKLF
ncbi:MAG: lipid-A-disaccharide synthase [Pleurocapsa sp.]